MNLPTPALILSLLAAGALLPAQSSPMSLHAPMLATADRTPDTEEPPVRAADRISEPEDLSLNLPTLQDDEEPMDEWTGSINAGGYMSLGNTERRSANVAAIASRRTEQDRITLWFNWDYAEDKNQATNLWRLSQRRTSGKIKYDYFLSEVSYWWASVLAEGDTLADIDLRLAATTGYGHQWVERDDLSFLTELGIGYFKEDYRTPGVPSNETVALRGAWSLMWQINENLKFLQDFEVFPSIESSDDVFLRKDSRLQLAVSENMFTQFQWILDYDNTPSPGRERVDHRFFVSVGWSF